MVIMTELWKQCATWLCRLKVLPANHRITWPDAGIQDLAYTLRDGVLLCHVAAVIDSCAVDMRTVNQRPQMAQFLCLKNIRVFLAATTESFGLKEIDLFHPSMLYDYTDFARVLHTLSKLSNCQKAKNQAISGFPATAKAPSQAEEQIYRTLEDLVTEDKYEDFYYRHHGGTSGGEQYYTALRHEQPEEDIYEDLCAFKNNGYKRLQRELNFQPKEKRDYCIKELVETEGNYVDVLNMLRKYFIRTITSMKDTDKRVIFMNIKELGETHAAFYQDILESITGKSRKKVGEIFLETKERFLKYGEYCSDLPRAQETLDLLLNKQDAVREEVQKCEMLANEGKFRLRDLLAVPMQRVLKYHLLLRELMSNTPPSHEEHAAVTQAYEAMLDVSDFINEVKRDSEQMALIKEIQNSITAWDMPAGMELKDYGRLRKDGELKVQSHENTHSNKPKLRYVFVFDRVVLLCKASRSGDQYEYKSSLKMADYKLQDVPPVRRLGGLARGDGRWGHAFVLAQAENAHAYTLLARTEEDKAKWMAGIKEALDNLDAGRRSSHDARMHTFEKPVSCDYCHKLLKGLFFQGYQCHKCQRAMHKDCISLLSKCGSGILPPALPPRPPSMQMPTARLDNRFSSCSIDDGTLSMLQRQSSMMSVTSLPPPNMPAPILFSNQPQHPLMVTTAADNPDYINTNMETHSWFVGDLDREKANARLADYPGGAFLVRCRTQNGERVGYALSLKTGDDVKHMKICQSAVATDALTPTSPNNSASLPQWFFLSDNRKFRSIVELVSYFSRSSLKESFNGLDQTLAFPAGEFSIAEALFDYDAGDASDNRLPLNKGERVTIIDKSCGDQGWWKAMNNSRAGFIPRNFVVEVRVADDPENGSGSQEVRSEVSEEQVLEPTAEEESSGAGEELDMAISEQDPPPEPVTSPAAS